VPVDLVYSEAAIAPTSVAKREPWPEDTRVSEPKAELARVRAKHAAKANVVDPIPGEDPEFIDLEPVVSSFFYPSSEDIIKFPFGGFYFS